MWNEPDNNYDIFFNGSAREFYGIMTAAYEALKKGSNNEAMVLQGAMCLADVSPFARDLFALGVGKYTDAFNWHSYEPPSSYTVILNRYRRACNLGAATTWMTEAGIFLGKSPDGDLNADDARKQCDFIPKSIAQSSASGNSKHFFFILPYFPDGEGPCLGALRKDLTPNPSVIALSAAEHLVGSSDYVRSLEFSGVTDDRRRTHASAVFFKNPSGDKTIVAWANETCDAQIPIEAGDTKADIKLADIFGHRESVDSDDGSVFVRLSPEPKYILITKGSSK